MAKRCRSCNKLFDAMNSLQIACSPRCAIELASTKAGDEHRQKAIKRDTRERMAKLKSRSQWMKEAQAAFNKWIRLRDEKEPCISCGRYHDGQWHAGHYRPTGSHPELRFEEMSVHKQCQPCNAHLSGNLTEYRKHLIEKIGVEQVEWLEGPHEPKKYTIDDLKAIKRLYAAKVKEIAQNS